MERFIKNLQTLSLSTVIALGSADCAATSDAPHIWPMITKNSMPMLPKCDDFRVAVMDSGHAYPEDKRIVEKFNARDGGISIDASVSKDPLSPYYGKIHSHGTHVSGIVSDMNSHIGVVFCKLGQQDLDQAMKNAFEALCFSKEVKIINLSCTLNWDYLAPTLSVLVKQGKTIVISAGNYSKSIDNIYLSSQGKWLSKFLEECKGRIILVGATTVLPDGSQHLACYSNTAMGALAQHYILAPGTDILSTVPKDSTPSGYDYKSGTSMSAPVMVGMISRLATHFGVSVDVAREVLFATSNAYGYSDFDAAYDLLETVVRSSDIAKQKTRLQVAVLEKQISVQEVIRDLHYRDRAPLTALLQAEQAKLSELNAQLQVALYYGDIQGANMLRLRQNTVLELIRCYEQRLTQIKAYYGAMIQGTQARRDWAFEAIENMYRR